MRSVRLSPVDHIFTGPGSYPVEFLLKYSDPLDPEVLQKSLHKIMGRFWPLAGQLHKQDENTLKVVWNSEIPQIKISDCRDRDFPDLTKSNELKPLSVPVYSDLGQPLSNFHLYQFKNGSALVANISHCIVDGYSYFYFLSQWAERTKGLSLKGHFKHLLARPDHRRELLVHNLPGTASLSFDNEECFRKLGISLAAGPQRGETPSSDWIFHDFAVEEVESLRKNENALSSHDILSALLLKKLIAEGGFFGEHARIAIVFDYRRVLPELSPKYFGNALRATPLEIATGEVQKLEISKLARLFRAATRSVNAENSRQSLAYLESARLASNGGLGFIRRMQIADEQQGLLITNLSRAPLKMLDFGSGAPTEIVALTPAPRSALITRQGSKYSIRVSPNT